MKRKPSPDRFLAAERPPTAERSPRLSFLTLALVTAALYFGREVLIPLAVALLITFILTPLVQRLQKMRLGRVPAVLLVVVVVFGAVGAVGWMMGSQIVDFAETLPRYEQNIRAKAAAIRGGRSSKLKQAQRTVEHLQEELGITPPNPATAAPARLGGKGRPAAPPAGVPVAPVPVSVIDPPESPLTLLRETLFPLLGPLGTAFLVIIFVIFMLIQREDLRDRLLRLLGQGRLNASTQALDEAAERVSKYLVMQFLINLGMGTAVGIGLFFIGVPNAVLWGLFAAILRFVPYVGSMIAAALPVLVSLAVFPGWQQPLLAFFLFLIIEVVTGNVIEPLVYGAETGISTIGILVAAVFWTWLWGPVGLLMSTPLTVCLVVLGRYVRQLQFLDVLLGDQPPLPLEAQVYHRLLALDADEVGVLLESSIKERTVAEFYDGVLIPALILAERDRHRGELSPEREEFIETTVRDWIEELAARTREDGSLGIETVKGENAAERLVCVPAHDVADELAGHMFAQLAVRGGKPAVLEFDLPRSEMLRRLAELGAEQVFISALEPFAYSQAREMCRDLRSHFPGMRIVVALWDLRAEADRHRRRLAAAGADEVVATLAEAVLAIRLTPTREVDPVALCADLEKAFRDVDLAHAESLLAEAERLLPVADLAVEVLQPALEGLRDDLAAGRMTAEQEEVAGALLRQRVIALGEAAPQVQGYRALAASAPEEEEEIGLLILALLMRRAGWSVVHLGQRAADEGFGEVIASVQPHAILFSAVQRPSADRLLGLADGLHRQHPELLFVLDGPGFRPSAVARLDGAAMRVGDDARDALAAIARRMPPLPPPPPPSEADLADEKAEHEGDPELDGDETQVGALRPPASGMYGPAKPGTAKPSPAKPDTPRAA